MSLAQKFILKTAKWGLFWYLDAFIRSPDYPKMAFWWPGTKHTEVEVYKNRFKQAKKRDKL